MSRLIARCAVLLAVVAGSANADDAVLLRYKLGKDDKLPYRSSVTMTQNQSVGGASIDIEMQTDGVALRTLDKVDDKGNFRVKSEEKALKVTMKMGPLGDYAFDSASDKRDEGNQLAASLNPLYEKLKNAVSYSTVTPRGEIESIEGLTEILAEATKNDPIAQQFATGTSEKAQKLSVSELYPVLSEKPVKPGDTWETKYELEIPQLGKAEGKRIFTYEAADKVGDRKTARIRVTHELAFDLDIDRMGAKVKGKLQIDQSSGVIQFDVEKGQLVSLENTYVLGGNLTLDAGGKLIPVKQSQTQTVKVELLDKLPEAPTSSK
jgi:hypothetical protein